MSLVMFDYNKKFDELRPFQKEAVNILRNNTHFLLADDCGLGKTVSTLMSIGNKAVIICPKSLKLNWKKECEKWRPDLKPIVLKTKEAGLKCPNDGELVIINPEILPDDLIIRSSFQEEITEEDEDGNIVTVVQQFNKNLINSKISKEKEKLRHKRYLELLHQDFRYVTLVVDEAHKLCNIKNIKTMKVRFLALVSGRCWLLTGTPESKGDPLKLYHVLGIANLIKKAFTNAKNYFYLAGLRFNIEKKIYEQVRTPSPEFNKRLKTVMLRRKKEEVFKELPQKIISYVPCEIDNKEIQDLLDTYSKQIDYSKYDLPAFNEFSIVRAKLAEAKYDMVLEMINDYERKCIPVLVFSSHKEILYKISQRNCWTMISGDNTPNQRQKIVDQQDQYKGICLSTKCADVGLTLTHFCNSIFIDLDWNTVNNNQAFDRTHRISQTQTVHIKILVANHKIDEHCINIITRADDNIKKMIDGDYND